MTIEASLVTALGALVGGRIYPDDFPLSPPSPTWPAIRYTIVSEVPAIALCGDSGVDDNETRIQLDLVSTSFLSVRALRASVVAAMSTFTPPAIRESGGSGGRDAETKTFRWTMDYVIHE